MEAACLTNKALLWRDTFWNELPSQSRPLPPEKTGRHTLLAHREHQLWLKGSPWDCPLCSPAVGIREPGPGQCHLCPHTPNPGPRALGDHSVCVPSQWPAPAAQVPSSYSSYPMLSRLGTMLASCLLSPLHTSFLPWRNNLNLALS